MPFQKGHKLGLGNQYAKGTVHTQAYKDNMSRVLKGNTNGFKKGQPSPRKGKKSSKPAWNKGLKGSMTGDKSPRWIHDRTKVKLETERNSPLHKQWSKSVKSRDGWKCKISNSDCKGKIVAHHILPWRDYPELRYILNNGISLCETHHPRKRQEEKILASSFFQLIDPTISYSNLIKRKAE